MNTYRETILQAVLSRLTGLAGVPVVSRSRTAALNRDELPAIVVKPGTEDVNFLGRASAERRFDVHIHVHARGEPADQAADSVVAAMHAALFTDETLGGLVARLIEKETTEPEFADGDDSRVELRIVYTAVYLTNARDITRLAS